MRQRQALAHIEYVPQKSPIYTAKEPYMYRTRALYILQKSPIYSAQAGVLEAVMMPCVRGGVVC